MGPKDGKAMWTRLQQFFVRRTDKVVGINVGAGSNDAAPRARSFARWRTGRISLASALVVVVFCGGIYGFNEAALDAAKRQLDDAQRRNELLRPMREKKLQVDTKLEIISQKQAVLNTLTKDRLSCYVVLAEAAAKTPQQLRLTDLEVSKGLLKIGGIAPNRSDLALFIERLEKDEILTEPALIKAETAAALTANQFQMTVKIRER